MIAQKGRVIFLHTITPRRRERENSWLRGTELISSYKMKKPKPWIVLKANSVWGNDSVSNFCV